MKLAQDDSVVAVACVPCEDESTENVENYDVEIAEDVENQDD